MKWVLATNPNFLIPKSQQPESKTKERKVLTKILSSLLNATSDLI